MGNRAHLSVYVRREEVNPVQVAFFDKVKAANWDERDALKKLQEEALKMEGVWDSNFYEYCTGFYLPKASYRVHNGIEYIAPYSWLVPEKTVYDLSYKVFPREWAWLFTKEDYRDTVEIGSNTYDTHQFVSTLGEIRQRIDMDSLTEDLQWFFKQFNDDSVVELDVVEMICREGGESFLEDLMEQVA